MAVSARERRVGLLTAAAFALILSLLAFVAQPSSGVDDAAAAEPSPAGTGDHAAAAEHDTEDDTEADAPDDASDDASEPRVASADPVAIEVACPAAHVLPARFDDVPTAGTHAASIDCLWWYGLAGGRPDGTYRPLADISRAAFATLLVRLLEVSGAELPATPADAFTDDVGNVHEPALDTLAALGIMGGSGEGVVMPGRPVKRGQIASMLVAAWPHLTGETLPREGDVFPDDDGNLHEDALDRLGTIGLLLGGEGGDVLPEATGTRAQLSTMLARVLARTVEAGVVVLPTAVEVAPVRGRAEVTVESVDPHPSVYAVDETVPVDQVAVDAFVAATTRWLDAHLTELAAGDASRLESRLVAPLTHARWRAATTDLLWRTSPSRVIYRITVAELGAPQWAVVEVRVTRGGELATWEVLVVPAGDDVTLIADGPAAAAGEDGRA